MLRLLGILALGNMISGNRPRYHRRNDGLLGSLLILPALMVGGWVAIIAAGCVLGLIGSVIGGIFSGLSSLASTAFSGSGIVIGIVLGLALYTCIRRQKNEAAEE